MTPRDDLLVSVAIQSAPRDETEVAHVAALAAELAARFRYFELLIADEIAAGPLQQRLIAAHPALRLLRVRAGTTFYQQRRTLAEEAIGDVVVLTALAELPHLEIPAMAERAARASRLVIGQHASANPIGPFAAALGRSAGLRIGAHDMLTMAVPRGLLALLLAHPDRLLALRFPPLDARLPVAHQDCRHIAGLPTFRGGSDSGPKLVRRLHILHRLTISSAPRVLTLVALAGLITAIAALLFAVYAVFAWALLAHIQPGWFTTALAISLTAAFLGGAVFGLAIGLQRVIEALTASDTSAVVEETGAADLFGQVIDELNVHAGSDTA